eukprot:11207042-Lingulodinium_polyedra.AAC.1
MAPRAGRGARPTSRKRGSERAKMRSAVHKSALDCRLAPGGNRRKRALLRIGNPAEKPGAPSPECKDSTSTRVQRKSR